MKLKGFMVMIEKGVPVFIKVYKTRKKAEQAVFYNWIKKKVFIVPVNLTYRKPQ